MIPQSRNPIEEDEHHVETSGKQNQKCVDYMIDRMKEVDPIFEMLYQKVTYTGSFYEGTRVGEPNEYDINFVLREPFKIDVYEGVQTSRGYAQLEVTKRPLAEDCNGAYKWVQNGFISAERVICWWEGVISKAFDKCGAAGKSIRVPYNYSERRTTDVYETSLHHYHGDFLVSVLTKSGPAITLRMQNINASSTAEKIDVDFVPVFEFQYPYWLRRTKRVPPLYTRRNKICSATWCVTPKFLESNPSHWRLSFASVEKEILADQANLKTVYRLMKRLRDCSDNLDGIKSYHIKSLFLWKIGMLKLIQWKKPLGRLFIMMLFGLENCLQRGQIPFFWDKKMNMIKKLDENHCSSMYGQISKIRVHIRKLLINNDLPQLQEYVLSLFDDKEGSDDDDDDNDSDDDFGFGCL